MKKRTIACFQCHRISVLTNYDKDWQKKAIEPKNNSHTHIVWSESFFWIYCNIIFFQNYQFRFCIPFSKRRFRSYLHGRFRLWFCNQPLFKSSDWYAKERVGNCADDEFFANAAMSKFCEINCLESTEEVEISCTSIYRHCIEKMFGL